MLDRMYKLAQIVGGVATAVLVALTFVVVRSNTRYIALTNQLLLQQQSPEVELAFSPPLLAHELVIHNSGPQTVVEVRIWWTAYLRDDKGAVLSTFYHLPPSAASPQGWWEIQSLAAGRQESKALAEAIDNVGKNVDVTESLPGLKNAHVQLSTRVVFSLQYRREVDRKLYSSHIDGVLLKDSQTGKYFLRVPSFTPEPPISGTPAAQ